MTMPPPTPNSALKNPATRPIRTTARARAYATSAWRRTDALLDAPHVRARRGRHLPRLRRRARADRRPARGRVPAARDARRARAARRALRARRASSAAARATTCSERVGVDGIVYVGSHGLELDREAERWRQQIARLRVERRRGRRGDRAEGADGRVPLPRPATTRARRCASSRSSRSAHATTGSSRASAARCSRCCRRSARTRARRSAACSTDAGLTRALVAGDDTTDLDAFRAVEELEHAFASPCSRRSRPRVLAEHADTRRSATHGRVPRAAAPALMHVDEPVLEPVRERYGEPAVLPWDGEISDVEWRDRDAQPGARRTT